MVETNQKKNDINTWKLKAMLVSINKVFWNTVMPFIYDFGFGFGYFLWLRATKTNWVVVTETKGLQQQNFLLRTLYR